MSFDTRNSALSKRAEQLKRWEESDTNREPSYPKTGKDRRVKFSSGCVFLAACMSGDKDEVLRLLDSGADIDTANVDGLTALHQACIDGNLEMVEFLVQHGSDINRQDNEGWTPLHATSSCGLVSIARYLIENGADLAAINSDGELAIDLADSNSMEELLKQHINEQGIDCDEARQWEERLMLEDAKEWLRHHDSGADRPHPRTGATALHVAAAKGYTKVLSLLLAGRADVDKQDHDGWTPLHSAAHWGQKEAAQMLVAAQADMNIKNYAGQTVIDIADSSIVRFLEELKKSKIMRRRPASQIRISDNFDNHIESPPKVIRVDVGSEGKDNDDPVSKMKEETLPPKSLPTEKPTPEEEVPWRRPTRTPTPQTEVVNTKPDIVEPTPVATLTDAEVILRRTQSFENDDKFYKKYKELRERIKANSCPILPASLTPGITNKAINEPNIYVQRSASLKDHRNSTRNTNLSPPTSPTTPTATTPVSGQVRRSFVPPVRDEESETQRKAHAKRVRETRRSTQGVTLDEIKSAEELVKKKNLNNNNNNSDIGEATTNVDTITTSNVKTSSTTVSNNRVPNDESPHGQSVTQNIAGNSETAKSDSQNSSVSATFTLSAPNRKQNENNGDKDDNKISASYTIQPSLNTSPTTNTVTFSASLLNTKQRDGTKEVADGDDMTVKITETNVESTKDASPVPTADGNPPVGVKPAFLEKRGPVSANNILLGSRYTRDKRSLFDIDNANSISLADKLRNEANKYTENSKPSSESSVVVSSNSKSSSNDNNNEDNDKDKDKELELKPNESMKPSSPSQMGWAERRPSWRMKFDAGSKFKLEDASTGGVGGGTNQPTNSQPVYATNPAISTIALRRQQLNATANQSTITGRTTPNQSNTNDMNNQSSNNSSLNNSDVTSLLRRTKNIDDKDNDKENDSRSAQSTQAIIQRRRRPKRRSTGVVNVDVDDLDDDKQDSPCDADDKGSGSERTSRSRLGSSSSINSEHVSKRNSDTTQNGDNIDYKALYEAERAENEKLRLLLKKKDDEIQTAKGAIERFTNATTKNSITEMEKRERRALERKLSEMEEELKLQEPLKAENQRLKEENGALIRVISKLSK